MLKLQRRVTEKEIAYACGVARQTVSNWLKGKRPRDKHLASLSTYFDVTVDYLVRGERDDDRERILQSLNEGYAKLPTDMLRGWELTMLAYLRKR